MTGRNAPCPCGSGRKFKHCCLGKKARTRSVTIDMGEPRKIDRGQFDPRTGEVKFYYQGRVVQPVSAKMEVSYGRQKGDKILTRIPLPGDYLVADSNRALEKYDLLLAVDTNTKRVGDEVVSVTCLVAGKPLLNYLPGHTAVPFGARTCFEFWGATENHERIGWIELLDALQRSDQYSNKMLTALIVDAHLDTLKEMNERTSPILGDRFLPKNMALLYASTDAAIEGIANKMLSVADAESAKILSYVLAERPPQSLQAAEGKPYTHYRIWNRGAGRPTKGQPAVRLARG